MEKERKWQKRLIKIGGCFLAFAIGLVSTYFLVPNRVETINLGSVSEEPEESDSCEYLNKVIGRLAPLATDAGLIEPFALTASFDDLSISWPNNEINVAGEINLSMKNLDKFAFTVDLDVNYNGQSIDVGVGYIDEVIYLATKDLQIKANIGYDDGNNVQMIELVRHINEIFFDKANEDGLRMTLDFDDILDGLLDGLTGKNKAVLKANPMLETEKQSGGIDIVDVMGRLEKSETVEGDVAHVSLAYPLNDDTKIKLKVDIDTNTLKFLKIDLCENEFGNAKLSGVLNVNQNSKLVVYPLDSENYSYKNRGEFIEVVKYSKWADDLFRLLKTRTVGLDLNASVLEDDYSIVQIESKIDVDASRFELLNLADKVFDSSLFEKKEQSLDTEEAEVNKADKVISILNDIDFNIGFTLKNYVEGEQGESILKEYSNLNLAYFKNLNDENAGYLSFNDYDDEAVMKAKVEVPTINYLIDKITDIVDEIKGNDTKAKSVSLKENEEEGLFVFITSSELISAIYQGQYDGIIKMIKDISSTDSTIKFVVGLDTLGFGQNSEVELVLNALNDEENPTKVLSINIKNVEISSIKINLNLSTRPFSTTVFEKINNSESTFDKLDFLEGISDQVYSIVSTKQASVKLNGSAFDEAGLGFSFDGWTQFDYGVKNGFGSINFKEYKHSATTPQTDHLVDISIDNFDGNHALNNMLFEYRDKLRGKFTLKTFDDIFALISKLLENPDTRFTKFFKPLVEDTVGSIVSDIVEGETQEVPEQSKPHTDYLKYTQKSYIKEIKQDAEGNHLDVIITKELLSFLDSGDLNLRINFSKRNDNVRELKSIEIIDLCALNKKINLEIELGKYDANKENPVDLEQDFLDFSDIAILLELGINTSELNYYHLTAEAQIDLNVFGAFDISLASVVLDFHVYVNGETVKVYGKMDNNPIPLTNNYSEFVYESDPADTSIKGGYFHILKTEKPNLGNLYSYNQTYYRADPDNFLENILYYLLESFLDMSHTIVKRFVGSESSSGSQGTTPSEGNNKDPKYEDIILENGFVYNHEDETGTHSWDLGISVSAITENNTIGNVIGTIYGKDINDVGYLTSLSATTSILNILPLKLNLALLDPNPEVLNWPDEIESRYQTICNIYQSLSEANQAKAHNNPTGGYTVSQYLNPVY